MLFLQKYQVSKFHGGKLATMDSNATHEFHCLSPSPSSIIFICGFYPWMRFRPLWMTSIDDTFIHGWNCHSSDFAHIEQNFGAIMAKICNLFEQNVMDEFSSMDDSFFSKSHPWMEKSHPWMTYTDEDDRWRTRIEPFSSIVV